MKKVLFSASLMLLAVSCTQDEFDSLSVQNEKGISIEAGLMENAQSRADMEWNEDAQKYDFFWWAEQDVISVWGTQVNGTDGVNPEKYFDADKLAKYKATKSEARGQFTGVDNDQILNFNYKVLPSDNAAAILNKTSRFFAVYPESVEMLADEVLTGDDANQVQLINLPVLAEQTNNEKGANEVSQKVAMFSYTTAYKEKGYDAVGEKINLEFIRPFTALIFKTVGADDYKTDFGALQTIKVEAKGYDKDPADELALDAAKGDILPSVLANETPEVGENDVLTIDLASKEVLSYTMSKPVSTVELDVNRTWEDADRAYAAINFVDRKDFKAKNVKEKMEITYTFNRIEFVKEIETNANWPSVQGNNKFIDVPALDITSYDYLVTLPTTLSPNSNDRTLIVNKGTFSSIFKSGTDNKEVLWAGASVATSEFSTIVSEVELTADELAMLKNFTNVKNVTLKKNTSIPSKTFTTAQATTMIKLDMPKVTSIADDFHTAGTFGALETLKLGSYNFASPKVNAAFFNASTKISLKVLDMSGVENMLPDFGIDRSLSFEGYALEVVTVQDGMKVAPKGFKNCTKLHTINGVVDLLNGEEAFAGSGNVGALVGVTQKYLTTINVNSTVITAGAFNGCEYLANVLYNGAQVVPTVVEDLAFYNAKELKYMDLSNLNIVGINAFNSSGLVGPAENVQIMNIGAEKISFGAFSGTKMTMVNFTNATVIENKILQNVPLVHLKFTKAFTVNETTTEAWVNVFGANPLNIDLFINPAQKYMSTKTKMSLPYKSGSDVLYSNFQFKTVQKQ